jgi:hypothetical protein
MPKPQTRIIILVLFGAISVLSPSTAFSQLDPKDRPVPATLIESGSIPFHLQAVITEPSDPNEHIDVEMFWVSPNKWRRTIKSQEFSQAVIANHDKVFEQNSADYMPLAIQVLITAMVDPGPIVAALRPGDLVATKANGKVDESGRVCLDPAGRMCVISRNGLTESLGGAGRCVTFTNYEKFKGQRVARSITYRLDQGDSYQARITTLGEFKSNDETEFVISDPTPLTKQIRSSVLQETDLRALATQPMEIIWPQVLEDNNTSGQTRYYVSIDRSGQVREILPLSVSVERADDSARRQIMRWKFNPMMRDGAPVQAEAILNFNFNTRAYGPQSMLTDTDVRKLATNTVDPVFPLGTASGAFCNTRIAVDSDGRVIEEIAADETPGLGIVCMNAIGKWHFSPILEDGKPRPYRAEITFHAP